MGLTNHQRKAVATFAEGLGRLANELVENCSPDVVAEKTIGDNLMTYVLESDDHRDPDIDAFIDDRFVVVDKRFSPKEGGTMKAAVEQLTKDAPSDKVRKFLTRLTD